MKNIKEIDCDSTATARIPQLPHESFRVVHLTKNYKPKQHQETQIIMLILNRKTSQQWLVFVFITKAFVTIEISPHFCHVDARKHLTSNSRLLFFVLQACAISKCDSSFVGRTKIVFLLLSC